MKKSLPIRTPCPYGESWRDMTKEDGGRRCERCDRHLLDISLLTRSQAKQLKKLSAKVGGLCASVQRDARGAPIYARTKTRRLVVTAGAVLSVSLAACTEPAEPEVAPSAAPDVEARAPGTSTAGAAEESPTNTAAPDVENDVPTTAEAAIDAPSDVEGDVVIEADVDAATPEPSTASRRTRGRENRRSPNQDPLAGLVF